MDYEHLMQIKAEPEHQLVVGLIHFSAMRDHDSAANVVVLDQHIVGLKFPVTDTAQGILKRPARSYTPLDRSWLDDELRIPVKEGMIASIVSFIDTHYEVDPWNWSQAFGYGYCHAQTRHFRFYLVYPPQDDPDRRYVGEQIFFKARHGNAWIEFECGQEVAGAKRKSSLAN